MTPPTPRCDECGKSFASHRGLASHNGRVHSTPKPKLIVCPSCGAVVGDGPTHEAWHHAQAKVATQAMHADMMHRPLGGPTS